MIQEAAYSQKIDIVFRIAKLSRITSGPTNQGMNIQLVIGKQPEQNE